MKIMPRLTVFTLATIVAFPLVAVRADAGTASSSITVSATVLTACTISSLPLAFGNYDPTGSSPTTGSTSVTALCTLSAPYTIALNNGVGTGASASGGSAGRKMTLVSGTQTLGYNLYQDSGYATVWGNGSGQTLSATGTGLAQAYTVYGRIPASQTASNGAYLDTVTATLTF